MTSQELVSGCIVNNYRMSSVVLKKVVADPSAPKKANIGRIYAKVKFTNANSIEGMEDQSRTKVFWAEVAIKGTDLEGKVCIENEGAINQFINVWKKRAAMIAEGDVDNPALLINGAVISVPVDPHYKLRNSVGYNGEAIGTRFKAKNEKGLLEDKVYHDIVVFILFDHVGNASKDPLKEALSILNNPSNCTRVPQVNSAAAPVTPVVAPKPADAIADISSAILGSSEDDNDIKP